MGVFLGVFSTFSKSESLYFNMLSINFDRASATTNRILAVIFLSNAVFRIYKTQAQ